MIVDKHVSLTSSGDTGLGLMSAWHLKATTDLQVNIRGVNADGMIVIPLQAAADIVIGNTYEHPLSSPGGSWYVEFVSGTGRVTMSGR